MNYSYSTFNYAGIQLDGFLTDSGKTYLTAFSIAKGVDKTSSQANDWLRYQERSNDYINVKVKAGVRGAMQPAKAYPSDLMVDMVDYWADKGHEPAIALRSASFKADLQRTIRETNGQQVTAAQHEKVRETIREELLTVLLDRYKSSSAVEKIMMSSRVKQDHDLTKTENSIYFHETKILQKQHFIEEIQEEENNERDIELAQKSIESAKQQIKEIRQKAGV